MLSVLKLFFSKSSAQDEFRALVVLGVLVFLVLVCIHSATHGWAFDMTGFGDGFGTVLVAAGAALGLRASIPPLASRAQQSLTGGSAGGTDQ